MSIAISYKDLSDASKNAKKVADKFEDYADELNSRVIKKLDNYKGDWTSNLSSARADVSAKVSAMMSMKSTFDAYSKDLDALGELCESTDKAVRTRVSELTTEFKKNNGIRNSKIENFCGYLFTSIGNSTANGRFNGNTSDAQGAVEDYINQQIKVWYNYEGGKDLIKGILVSALEIAAAVISVVLIAIGSVTGVLEIIAAVATVVLAVIGIVNAVVNIINESRAYNANQSGDPALALRLSNEDTLQSVLRDGNITDEANEGWLNNHVGIAKDIAMTIDVVEFVANICVIAKDGYKLYQNCAKWATANGASTFGDAAKLVFGNIKNNFKEIGQAIKIHDLSSLNGTFSAFKYNFKYNFTKNLLNFGSTKDTLGTVKNYLGISKDLIKGGFGFSNIVSTGFKDVVIPNITVFTVMKDEPSINLSGVGTRQLSFDFYDHITVDSFSGLVEKLDTKIFKSPIFKSPVIDNGIINKLSTGTSVSVAFAQ